VEKLVKDQQREKYAQAMAKLADAIRYSGGDPTDEDRELMKDLFSRDIVQDIQKDYFKRVNENLRDEKISRVKSIYPKLAAVDASANEFDFFNKNKGVGVKRIERTDGPSSDDDEAEETDE
jgi:hypothetical protein